MITHFHVRNYKALRDVKLDLTPIHVLIGPNDSGKTSILDAIAALCRSVDHPLAQAFTGSWEGRSLVWRGEPDLDVSFTATVENGQLDFNYKLSCGFRPLGRDPKVQEENLSFGSESQRVEFSSTGHHLTRVCGIEAQGRTATSEERDAVRQVHDALVGIHDYRWIPRFLALPVALDAKRGCRMEPSGFGLAQSLDGILSDDRNQFIKLEERFREVFPHIKSIKLRAANAYRTDR